MLKKENKMKQKIIEYFKDLVVNKREGEGFYPHGQGIAYVVLLPLEEVDYDLFPELKDVYAMECFYDGASVFHCLRLKSKDEYVEREIVLAREENDND